MGEGGIGLGRVNSRMSRVIRAPPPAIPLPVLRGRCRGCRGCCGCRGCHGCRGCCRMVVISVVVGIVMIDVVIVVVVVVDAPYETSTPHRHTTTSTRWVQRHGVDPNLIRRDTRLLFNFMAYQAG